MLYMFFKKFSNLICFWIPDVLLLLLAVLGLCHYVGFHSSFGERGYSLAVCLDFCAVVALVVHRLQDTWALGASPHRGQWWAHGLNAL